MVQRSTGNPFIKEFAMKIDNAVKEIMYLGANNVIVSYCLFFLELLCFSGKRSRDCCVKDNGLTCGK